MLTQTQLQALKADIEVNIDLFSLPNNSDGAYAIAALYGITAAPDFWVWRTNVSRAEIYHGTSPDATTWNWTTYKAQSAVEQNAWTQMFMGDQADFSKANLRAGVAAIFTGSAPQTAQRDHCLSMGRRKATRGEKLFATGTGSTSSPGVMVIEGTISAGDIETARNMA